MVLNVWYDGVLVLGQMPHGTWKIPVDLVETVSPFSRGWM